MPTPTERQDATQNEAMPVELSIRDTMDVAGAPAAKQPRSKVVWKHLMDASAATADQFLWALVQTEFGGTPANSQFWMRSD
jgi:hypothetical protein